MKMIIDTLIVSNKLRVADSKIGKADNVEILPWDEIERWKPKRIDYSFIYVDENLNMNEVLMKIQSKGVKIINSILKRY